MCVVPRVVWRQPDEGEMVLNVDGSLYKDLKRAGYGGVIRDHQGSWIGGFSEHIEYTNSLHAESVVTGVVWRQPDEGEMVLNVDGSSYKDFKRAGYGGVIRDHEGNWIGGFSEHIEYTNSLHAELLAILHGLLVVWDLLQEEKIVVWNLFLKRPVDWESKKVKKVNCRSDCIQALNFIKDPTFPTDEYTDLVDSIRKLVSRNWLVTFEHAYREGNQCADRLAKLGATTIKGTEISKKPPDFLEELLLSDARQDEYPRI